MKPIIGINCSFHNENDPFQNKLCLAEIYVQAVIKTGGIPILLPIVEGADNIRAMLDNVDGLLMSGGGGMSSQFANSELIPSLAEQSPVRHKFDLQLVKLALQRDLPILGICRGHQTINEAAGGTLHLSLTELTKQNHKQDSSDDQVCHEIVLEPNALIATLLGVNTIGVNSIHRQAVAELAPGFRAVAYADNQIIEAYESERHTFVMGCQFHPESLMLSDARFARVYEAFVEAAAKFSFRKVVTSIPPNM